MHMPAGMIGAGLDDGTGASDAIDRGVLLELGLAAMEELVKVAQVDDPLWLPSLDSGFETLNYDEYRRAFARVLGPSPAGFVSEATRDVGSVDLVNSLMDAARWSEMFPCVVARASTMEMISSGMGGTLNGTIQLMRAELQVLSPLVPIREVTFLRFCKQHAEGLWAVVDTGSVDSVLRPDAGGSAAAGYMGCRLLPSGCVVEDMRNGYSKNDDVDEGESKARRSMQNCYYK